jgi:hypothetical protein
VYRVTPSDCILRRKATQSGGDPEELAPPLVSVDEGGVDIGAADADGEEAAGAVSRGIAAGVVGSATPGWAKDGEREASRAGPTLGSRGAGLGPDAGLASDPTAIEPAFPDSMGGSRPGGADDDSSGFLFMAAPRFVVGRDRLPGSDIEPDWRWPDLSFGSAGLDTPGSGMVVGKGNGGGSAEDDDVEDAGQSGPIAGEPAGLCLPACLSAPRAVV